MSEVQFVPDPIAEIPLRSIEFEAIVAGLQAEVAVHQKFGNILDKPIEAIYVFPLDDEASILGFDIKIGNRTIKAVLKDKTRAKIEYEDGRDAGHHAAIVKQERPNIFTVSVAGIEPGEEIEATTRYMAPVPWQNNGGRLTFPTVVAPRFIPGKPKAESTGHGWSPDTDKVPDASKITPHIVAEVPYRVAMNLELTPGFACEFSSPSHPELLRKETYPKGETIRCGLDHQTPDKDIVICYKTFSERPNVAVYQTHFIAPDKTIEHFVLAQLTAPMSETSKKQRNVVFLLDTSGSMGGQKIEGLKKICFRILKNLSDDEMSQPTNVGIVEFSYDPHVLVKLSPVSEAHSTAIQQLSTRGGTYLGKATSAAMGLFMINKFNPNDSECCIVAISDGQTQDDAFQSVSGVRIHTIGIDDAVNNEKLKGFARKTGGCSEFVLPGENFSGVATAMVGLTTGPVVRGLYVKGLPDDASVFGISDLFSGRPVIMAIRSKKTMEELTISGRNTDGTVFNEKISVPLDRDTRLAPFVWAKNAMREITDSKKLTDISLRYGVLGSSTAFVAVSEKLNPTGKPITVEVPVLLPKSWEYGEASGTLNSSSPGDGALRRCTLGETARGGGPMLSRGAEPTLGYKKGLVSDPDDNTMCLLGSRAFASAEPAGGGLSHDEHIGSLCDEVLDSGELGIEEMMPSALDEISCNAAIANAPNPLLELAEEALQLLKSGQINEAMPLLIGLFLRCGEPMENFTTWSELDKARLYEVMTEINAWEIHFIPIPVAITVKPTDVDAYHCWCRAKTHLKEKIS
jgi:Ca-activated chloride channel family protein